MAEGVPVTGAADAVLLDTILDLGIDVDAAMNMSNEQRLERVRAAWASGELQPERLAALRAFGLPLEARR